MSNHDPEPGGPSEDPSSAVANDSPDLPDLADEPLITYSSVSEIRTPIKLFGEIYHDFLAGRELAWRLFIRNLRGLYRQTFFGLFWAFLPPIANTAVWIFLKSQNVFTIGDTGVNSTVYILTGMILWQAFIDAFLSPAKLLNSNKNMVSKLRFPRESLLLVALGETVFNLAIRIVLLIPAFLLFSVPLHLSILLAPLPIMGLILLGLAMGILLLPIGSLYQDVGRFITLILPFWMIITPIIYVPSPNFPESLLNWVNPAAPLLIVSRDLLLYGGTEFGLLAIVFGLAAIVLMLVSLVVYRVSLPVLIERMMA